MAQEPQKVAGDIVLKGEFRKVQEDQRLVFGWLYVHRDKTGKMIVDHSREIIQMHELEKASYEFVMHHRAAGEMHERTVGVGTLVECCVFTAEKRAAMGIPEGILPDGMWVGFKIFDDRTWEGIKSGKYKMFSLGGHAIKRQLRG